jgi:hypothetical protein
MKLVFTVPGPEAPGYLRRMRAALVFKDKFADPELVPTPETIDELVEFLLPYVDEPKDRDEARDALLDASMTQYNELLAAVAGTNSPNPT